MTVFRFRFVLVLLLTTFAMAGCKKKRLVGESAVLPPITQNGANTFGFVFQDKAWAHRSGVLNFRLKASLSGDTKLLDIAAERPGQNYASRNDWASFGIKDFKGPGRYPIPKNFSFGVKLVQGTDPQKDVFYELQEGGEVVISKFDPTARIISGEFSFSVKNAFSGAVSEVSQGRFDVVYDNW